MEILNYRENRGSSYLITFTHTLTYVLEQFAKLESDSQDFNFAKNINNKHLFLDDLKTVDFSEISEIIIDEAQDVEFETHNKLKELFKQISYGADNDQILYPNNSIAKDELENLFPENRRFTLHQNFRNSYEILQFTNSVFPNRISKEILDYAKRYFTTGVIPKLIVEDEQLKRDNRRHYSRKRNNSYISSNSKLYICLNR
ncbi:ATP-dependent exonuclase V beta subunit, helicase and exonuclease domain-containing [Thiovulum sp. ES]|nr:ATP-dependent exonuclase V beta subunit, helicase and exonuclease domain-containing [Thiovulum sp. ES]